MSGFDVMFEWCGECLQGVEHAEYTKDIFIYKFSPCGHTAPFYKRASLKRVTLKRVK